MGGGGGGMEELTEDKRALRRSKVAPLTSYFSSFLFSLSAAQYRLAHPGGPVKTNKAAALAKFLERKLQDPNGLSSIDPDLIELAVKNARDTVISSGTSRLRVQEEEFNTLPPLKTSRYHLMTIR